MNSNSLVGEVALVTGASRGIGRAISLALLDAGINVMATARSTNALDQLMDEARGAGGKCDAIAADLAEIDAAKTLVEATVKRFGQLDILVNNAGFLSSKPIAQTTIEEWERTMAVNARAPFLLSKAACPYLKVGNCGTIIQIVSVVGEKSYIKQGAYTASKHALMGFSKVLAQEVKQDNIRVHTVLPGGVDTDMTGQISPDLSVAELMAPADIAEIVMFLLTHRNNAVIDAIRVRRSVKDPWF